MNPNRMLSIIMLLLEQKRKITMPELAKIFGVALKTIYRDIDIMTEAGIPILNMQLEGNGIALAADFLKKLPDTTDIVETILTITDMYPKLLETKSYAFSQYKRLMAGNPPSKPQVLTVIQATIRFCEQNQNEIAGLYDLNAVSKNESGYLTAKIYIPNNKNEFNALLLLGNKCQCISPDHVRAYIKNKLKEIIKEYDDV